MTDTRKGFEEWFWSAGISGRGDLCIAESAWQACQSLNDKRIQQLLAVIAKKDEALIKACELIEKFSLQVYNGSDCLRVYDAVELQHADAELVEVGDFKVNEQSEWGFDPYGATKEHYDRTVKNVGVGTHKCYTIKTKANTK